MKVHGLVLEGPQCAFTVWAASIQTHWTSLYLLCIMLYSYKFGITRPDLGTVGGTTSKIIFLLF